MGLWWVGPVLDDQVYNVYVSSVLSFVAQMSCWLWSVRPWLAVFLALEIGLLWRTPFVYVTGMGSNTSSSPFCISPGPPR